MRRATPRKTTSTRKKKTDKKATAAEKSPATREAPSPRPTTKASAEKARKTAAKKTVAKKTAAKKTAARKATTSRPARKATAARKALGKASEVASHQEAAAGAPTSATQGAKGRARQASDDYLPAEDCLVSGDRVAERYLICGHLDGDELATYHLARRLDARPGQAPHVAVVELPTSVRHRKDLAEIEASIRAAGGVESPAIERLIEVVRSQGGRPLFVFPVPPTTLSAPTFDLESLAPRDAVSLVLDALDGMVALRDAGVLLESILPSQIVVDAGSARGSGGSPYRAQQADGPPRGKLSFLGLRRGSRRPMAELSRTTTWLGASEFMAPEVIAPRGQPTAQTYVYSAGLCLYHALRGEFSHLDGVAPTMRQIEIFTRGTSLPDARPAHIDPDLFAILRRAVARAEHRYASIEELSGALRGYLDLAAGPAAPAPPPPAPPAAEEAGGLLGSVGKATRRLFGKK